MEKIIPVGFCIFLLGSLILTRSKTLNRKKLISNGQEVTNSFFGTILILVGAVMIAIPFFVEI